MDLYPLGGALIARRDINESAREDDARVKMADTGAESTSVLNATGEDVVGATNGTGRVPATPEGMVVAYSSLVIMALLPIFIGSFRSVKHHKEQKVCSFTTTTITTMLVKMFLSKILLTFCAIHDII